MGWFGLSPALVLATFVAASAAVTALYFLRARRRRIRVPHVRLWDEVAGSERAEQLFARRTHLLSLAAALVIVACLAVALGDPRGRAAVESGRSWVVLVDTSPSMNATDVAPTRLAEAKRRVIDLAGRLGADDRMLVAAWDKTVRPAATFSGDRFELEHAVESLRAGTEPTSLEQALRFAASSLRNAQHGELVLVTDGAFEPAGSVTVPANLHVSAIQVGHGGENVALLGFGARRHPRDATQAAASVDLWNTGSKARRVALEFFGNGSFLDSSIVALAPGAHETRTLDGLTAVARTIEARVHAVDTVADDLASDDRAVSTMPERKPVRALVVSDGNLYLDAALLLDETLAAEPITPAAYRSARGYDVVFFDGWLPPSAPEVPAFYLNPVPKPSAYTPLRSTATMTRPFFDRITRDHPLLRFAALNDVNVASALQVTLEPGDVAVAADRRGALLVAGARGGQPFVALTFDVRQSDLPLRVAWPVLVSNAVDFLTARQRSGIASPSQVPNPRESDLAVPRHVEVGGHALAPPSPTRGPGHAWWPWLALVAWALSSLTWWTYHRRHTV